MNIPKRGERMRSVKRLLLATKIKGNEPLLAHSPVANYHLKIKQKYFLSCPPTLSLGFLEFLYRPWLDVILV